MVAFIENEIVFPPYETANEDGILAIGTRLDVEILEVAYNKGIFPWYNDDEPVLWWFPHERMVIELKDFQFSKRLEKFYAKQSKIWNVAFDSDFEYVINACKNIERKGQDGTWINSEIIAAYIELHYAGKAWSVAVKDTGGNIIGGLYGVDMNNGVFTGESMFSIESGASKFAFISLVKYLQQKDYKLLDCQVYNDYLYSLGARLIDKSKFLYYINANMRD